VEDIAGDSPMLTAVDLNALREHAEGASFEHLENLLTVEERRRLQVEFQLVYGNAYGAIMEYTRNHNIDMIVLGSSSRSAIVKFIMGSIADSIVRNAPCPVLSVKAPSLVAT